MAGFDKASIIKELRADRDEWEERAGEWEARAGKLAEALKPSANCSALLDPAQDRFCDDCTSGGDVHCAAEIAHNALKAYRKDSE